MALDRCKRLSEELLKIIFETIKNVLPADSYGMKGGYVLKTRLSVSSKMANVRNTNDIDIDIGSEELFGIVSKSVSGLAEQWKSEGLIYKYVIKNPTEYRNDSINIYDKQSENARARLLCGVDVAVHPVFSGFVVASDGSRQSTWENMLADKYCALYYNTEKYLLSRVRDVVDVYLILMCTGEQRIKLDEDFFKN